MNDRLALRLLGAGVTAGTLRITFPDGSKNALSGTEPGPNTVIHVKKEGSLGRVLRGGSNALVEAYMADEFEPEDLTELLVFAALNQRRWAERHPRLYGIGRKMGTWLPNRNHQLAVRTMADHYNLGNEFYQAWLDPTMTYSSARFGETGRSLEEAQLAKYARLAELCDLGPGQSVLEIGTGWGGMARYAASLGCHVTTLTIAKEQAEFAKAQNVAAGLDGMIDVQLLDYALVEGQFDRLISIEMIESIDDSRWPDFFDTIARVLKPGGRAGLQAILIHDDFFDSYRTNEDFIRRYIFPGGLVPSPSVLRTLTARSGLDWDMEERFGLDYAKTLASWHDRFEAAWSQIAPLGFDEDFRKMWRTYLSYCEAGFVTGRIDVAQFSLTRP
jgi:cyclopropane-fatty-acyl-phospholipid synthase